MFGKKSSKEPSYLVGLVKIPDNDVRSRKRKKQPEIETGYSSYPDDSEKENNSLFQSHKKPRLDKKSPPSTPEHQSSQPQSTPEILRHIYSAEKRTPNIYFGSQLDLELTPKGKHPNRIITNTPSHRKAAVFPLLIELATLDTLSEVLQFAFEATRPYPRNVNKENLLAPKTVFRKLPFKPQEELNKGDNNILVTPKRCEKFRGKKRSIGQRTIMKNVSADNYVNALNSLVKENKKLSLEDGYTYDITHLGAHCFGGLDGIDPQVPRNVVYTTTSTNHLMKAFEMAIRKFVLKGNTINLSIKTELAQAPNDSTNTQFTHYAEKIIYRVEYNGNVMAVHFDGYEHQRPLAPFNKIVDQFLNLLWNLEPTTTLEEYSSDSDKDGYIRSSLSSSDESSSFEPTISSPEFSDHEDDDLQLHKRTFIS